LTGKNSIPILRASKRKFLSIVILGYGLAGVTAAITARDLGAQVIVLEKQPKESHVTLSSIAGGFVLSLSDKTQALEYMTALCATGGQGDNVWTDQHINKAWVDYSAQNIDWLNKLGARIRFYARGGEFPELPGSDSMMLYRHDGCGVHMMRILYERAAERGIPVHYQVPAQRLITDGAGRVVGANASDISGKMPKELNIRATKAVIICTGGFEASEEMKLHYLRSYPMYFTGGDANTGDGIRMAQEAGADLWHMNCVSARLCAKFPDFPTAFFIDFSGKGWSNRSMLAKKEKAIAGFIFVDKYGRRYMTEEMKPHAAAYEVGNYDSHKLEFPRIPSWSIFDRRRIENGQVGQISSGPSGPQQLYRWSRDNSAELARGWIVKGDTLAELARQINMQPKQLERTVLTWNACCDTGSDPEFHRNPLELVKLDNPPFFAIKLYPGGSNTLGGPRRNHKSQVLNPFGEAIPSLYAAGECGSVYGLLYPAGGGNLAECIAFGRIAAENAVREAGSK